MSTYKHIKNLVSILLLAFMATSPISAKTASGAETLALGMYQGQGVSNVLTYQGKDPYSTTETSGSSLATRGLTPAQQARINTIDNIIENNAKPHDFEGVAKELSGVRTGFDHVTEMQQSVRGLEKSIRGLENSLKNPNLSLSSRFQIQSAIQRGQSTLDRMNSALGGK